MVMSADVRRHVLAIVLVLGCKSKWMDDLMPCVLVSWQRKIRTT